MNSYSIHFKKSILKVITVDFNTGLISILPFIPMNVEGVRGYLNTVSSPDAEYGDEGTFN